MSHTRKWKFRLANLSNAELKIIWLRSEDCYDRKLRLQSRTDYSIWVVIYYRRTFVRLTTRLNGYGWKRAIQRSREFESCHQWTIWQNMLNSAKWNVTPTDAARLRTTYILSDMSNYSHMYTHHKTQGLMTTADTVTSRYSFRNSSRHSNMYNMLCQPLKHRPPLKQQTHHSKKLDKGARAKQTVLVTITLLRQQ